MFKNSKICVYADDVKPYTSVNSLKYKKSSK